MIFHIQVKKSKKYKINSTTFVIQSRFITQKNHTFHARDGILLSYCEKIILVIEKKIRHRICKNFEFSSTICSVRSEQFLVTECFFKLFPGGFSLMINWSNYNSNWKKILGFRNMQEKLVNTILYETKCFFCKFADLSRKWAHLPLVYGPFKKGIERG